VLRGWMGAQLDSADNSPLSFRSTLLAAMSYDSVSRRALMNPQFMTTWVKGMMYEPQIRPEDLFAAVQEMDQFMTIKDHTSEVEVALRRGARGDWQSDPNNYFNHPDRVTEDTHPIWDRLTQELPGLARRLQPDAKNYPIMVNGVNIGGGYQGDNVVRGGPKPWQDVAIPTPVSGAPKIPFQTNDPTTGQVDSTTFVPQDIAPPVTPAAAAAPKALKIPFIGNIPIPPGVDVGHLPKPLPALPAYTPPPSSASVPPVPGAPMQAPNIHGAPPAPANVPQYSGPRPRQF
jgi:hypothetical protein